MIFSVKLISKILSGDKTVTRRVTVGKYRVGGEYAVQPGRGKAGIARIRVVSMQLVILGDINTFEAELEGFASVHDFLEYWREMHGRIDMKEKLWRIEFELIKVFPYRAAKESWDYICAELGLDCSVKGCSQCHNFFPEGLDLFFVNLDTWPWERWCWNCKEKQKQKEEVE